MRSRGVVLVSWLLAGAAVVAQQVPQSSSHGTINILLANGNGMVLLTDSRTSNHGRLVSDNSPKLFQLDDKTVCSIAGFYFDPGPTFELNLQIPGSLHLSSPNWLQTTRRSRSTLRPEYSLGNCLFCYGCIVFQTTVPAIAVRIMRSSSY